MTDIEAYRFKREIEELTNQRGRHTELITVYIPDGYDINKVIGKLYDEQGTSQNIKSKTTRKNVTAALERIIQHLKLFKQTPKNGLAVFCGNVSQTEGREDIQLHSLIPPDPLKIALYRCSQEFVLDPLLEMVKEKDVYALIVVDRREADIAFLKGKRIVPVKHMSSMVPGKFRAGGQSAARFERVIENLAKDWYKQIVESSIEILKDAEVKGIIVGGPGHSKNEFLDNIPPSLTSKILGVVDIGYTGSYGLEELVQRSEDLLKDAEITKEKQVIRRLLDEIAKDGAVTYGKDYVLKALEQGAADTILVSEGADKAVADGIVKRSQEFGTKVMLISRETPEGEQLFRIGGFAAFLRYKMD
ncbi:MAG: peptide chain release factor aRF-1 [archaeon]